jgi:hypothetical protein
MLREALSWRGPRSPGSLTSGGLGSGERLEESPAGARARLEADLAAGRHAAGRARLEGCERASASRAHARPAHAGLYRCGRQAVRWPHTATAGDGSPTSWVWTRCPAPRVGAAHPAPRPALAGACRRAGAAGQALPARPAPGCDRGRRGDGVAALLAGVAVSVSGDASSGARWPRRTPSFSLRADGRLGASASRWARADTLFARPARLDEQRRDGSVSRVDVSDGRRDDRGRQQSAGVGVRARERAGRRGARRASSRSIPPRARQCLRSGSATGRPASRRAATGSGCQQRGRHLRRSTRARPAFCERWPSGPAFRVGPPRRTPSGSR